MSKNPTIIVDIDGTLANCEHRLHHIRYFGSEGGEEATFKADWDAFYENCDKDDPIEPTCELVRVLKEAGWGVILITGRSYFARKETIGWLQSYNIKYDLLLMRRHGDHTADDKLKKEWLHDLREGRISISGLASPSIVLEDRARVVDMWREEGLICLQCDKGDF